MMKVSKLAYIGANATDLSAWKSFAPEVMGLSVAAESSEKLLLLRADERHHRLSINPSDHDDIGHIGWEVDSPAALQAMAARLEANGVAVSQGTSEEIADRHVIDMVHFTCPFTGIRHELSVGNEMVFSPRFQSTRDLSGFRTDELGLGHAAIYAKTDIVKVVDFYVSNLGFSVADWVYSPAGAPMAAFLYCNPRHHSLAIIFNPVIPRKVQHVFFETEALDDIGKTYDLCVKRQLAATGIGRHPNDHSVSLYFKNPSRWFIEYGWGLRVVDPSIHTMEKYILGAAGGWGHAGLTNLEDEALGLVNNN